LVLNTHGAGIDVGELCRKIRTTKRGLPILHIGSTSPDGLPPDVPTLAETFTPDTLLSTVRSLMRPGLVSVGLAISQPTANAISYPNGRRRGDIGSRSGVTGVALTHPGRLGALGRLSGRLWVALVGPG
jgi:hypothetical protein